MTVGFEGKRFYNLAKAMRDPVNVIPPVKIPKKIDNLCTRAAGSSAKWGNTFK